MRGEQYIFMRFCGTDTVGGSGFLIRYKEKGREGEDGQSDDGGNAEVSSDHLVCTSSAMLDAPLSRKISSTRREGPDITLPSSDDVDIRRNVRKRAPPRRICVSGGSVGDDVFCNFGMEPSSLCAYEK